MRLISGMIIGLMLSLPMAQAATLEGEGVAKVRQSLALLLPDLPIGEISATAVPGLYEVVLGQRVVYVTGDGRFLLQGTLIDLELQKNLTEPRLNAIKAAAVAGVGEERMIIYRPEKPKYSVTVFTDIDCGYCRKLHSEMAEYNAAGIEIRYLFYPRAGIHSNSYNKAVSVWCAEDRKAALTLAKGGATPEPRSCDNPVADHYALGESMDVTGTPALVLEDGRMLPGYLPPDRLLRVLQRQQSTAQ